MRNSLHYRSASLQTLSFQVLHEKRVNLIEVIIWKSIFTTLVTELWCFDFTKNIVIWIWNIVLCFWPLESIFPIMVQCKVLTFNVSSLISVIYPGYHFPSNVTATYWFNFHCIHSLTTSCRSFLYFSSSASDCSRPSISPSSVSSSSTFQLEFRNSSWWS